MCEYVVVGHTHANRDTRSRDRVGRIALYTRTHARANTHTHTVCVTANTHSVWLASEKPEGPELLRPNLGPEAFLIRFLNHMIVQAT